MFCNQSKLQIETFIVRSKLNITKVGIKKQKPCTIGNHLANCPPGEVWHYQILAWPLGPFAMSPWASWPRLQKLCGAVAAFSLHHSLVAWATLHMLCWCSCIELWGGQINCFTLECQIYWDSSSNQWANTKPCFFANGDCATYPSALLLRWAFFILVVV